MTFDWTKDEWAAWWARGKKLDSMPTVAFVLLSSHEVLTNVRACMGTHARVRMRVRIHVHECECRGARASGNVCMCACVITGIRTRYGSLGLTSLSLNTIKTSPRLHHNLSGIVQLSQKHSIKTNLARTKPRLCSASSKIHWIEIRLPR